MSEPKPPIIVSLESQLACYRRLQKLSDLQRAYVRENQTDELIEVLQTRSALLIDIARLEDDVAPLKRSWADTSLALSPVLRTAAAAMLAETRTLLQQITQADQDDVLLLQQRQLNVGKQIQQHRVAKQVNTRYAASAYTQTSGSRLNVKQ
ncbi:MAG: hypothetical protein JWM57_1280 [Phycisphaerales bacterium]|nr:hypothetical protein [Phycisphaerales bacterium]